MLPPPAGATTRVNGRSYTCPSGSTLRVPDFDADILEANGWIKASVTSVATETGDVVLSGSDISGLPVGFRNRLRNGSLSINQRAVSGTVTLAAGAYGHDGVKAGSSGATYTFAVSGIDTVLTVTAGSLIMPIEAGMIEGGTYTLSHAGTAQGRVWQGTGSSGSGSYAAAPFTTTSLSDNTQTNVEFSTGTVLRPQFEPGDVATTFERRPPGVELALNLRYFMSTYASGVAPGTAGAAAAFSAFLPAVAAYAVLFSGVFPGPMRATPTITIYSTNSGAAGFAYANNMAADKPVFVPGVSPYGCTIQLNNATGAVNGFLFNFTASAEI